MTTKWALADALSARWHLTAHRRLQSDYFTIPVTPRGISLATLVRLNLFCPQARCKGAFGCRPYLLTDKTSTLVLVNL